MLQCTQRYNGDRIIPDTVLTELAVTSVLQNDLGFPFRFSLPKKSRIKSQRRVVQKLGIPLLLFSTNLSVMGVCALWGGESCVWIVVDIVKFDVRCKSTQYPFGAFNFC